MSEEWKVENLRPRQDLVSLLFLFRHQIQNTFFSWDHPLKYVGPHQEKRFKSLLKMFPLKSVEMQNAQFSSILPRRFSIRLSTYWFSIKLFTQFIFLSITLFPQYIFQHKISLEQKVYLHSRSRKICHIYTWKIINILCFQFQLK